MTEYGTSTDNRNGTCYTLRVTWTAGTNPLSYMRESEPPPPKVDGLCMPNLIADLIIGEIPGAGPPEQTKQMAGAAMTRAATRRQQETLKTPASSPCTSLNKAQLVVVPTPLRSQVMDVAHCSLMGGHLGTRKTKDIVLSNFSWPGCAANKTPLIDTPFKRVAVDIVGPIKPASSEGHRYILTLVDYATRYPEAVPLKRITTKTVAEALVEIYSRLGIPEEVIHDRGTQFMSDCMHEVSCLLSLKQLPTTPYHPMSNGLVEKFNGTLKAMLSRLCAEQPRQWRRYLSPLLFAYREVPQSSTGFAPFELMYEVRGPMGILQELWTGERIAPQVKTSYHYVFDLCKRLEETMALARQNLEGAQSRYKRHYDRKTKARSFKAGDEVLVLLLATHNKLLMQWKGPLTVETRRGNVYQLKNAAAAVIEWEETNSESAISEDLLEALDRKNSSPQGQVEKGRQLSQLQCTELGNLTEQYRDMFSGVPGVTDLITYHIRTSNEIPVRAKPYPIPYKLREALHAEVQEMLDMGIIRESHSPYASQVVVVKKRDGTYWVCVDYRQLNKKVEFDPMPMSTVEDLLHKMGGAKYFCKIDLSKGYWQIPVAEEDVHKTAFVTPDGQYEFLRMPFGMVNAGATLVRAVKFLLKGMSGVESYIDDIIVHSATWEQHLRLLEELFRRIKAAGMTARPSKCTLATDRVEFIGHVLSNGSMGLLEDNLPILRLPDHSRSYILHTDASDTGIGAVLLQEWDGELFPIINHVGTQGSCGGPCTCRTFGSRCNRSKEVKTLGQIFLAEHTRQRDPTVHHARRDQEVSVPKMF
ncbi:uncharacterized protein LOC119597481 [Penaeus monodon]|uniref:uncharacterized protein LOC119597481 n=1 Tax=Penaeus monodon TaxID=6687 RepID=UPI0018A7652A|nr:uncharacterized protein LOC119597481 [Penaeus monodon]